MLYYSNICYYLFMPALRKSVDLSPPGCAQRVNLKGGEVKLRAFAESLRKKLALQSFTDKLFLMIGIG